MCATVFSSCAGAPASPAIDSTLCKPVELTMLTSTSPDTLGKRSAIEMLTLLRPLLVVLQLRVGDEQSIENATVAIKDEDHTIGNALRYMLMKNPDVEFCGYSIPHPSENKIHVRVQTVPGSGVSAVDVVRKALEQLIEMCSHVAGVVQTEFDLQPPVVAETEEMVQ
ncbi:hypothetical protein CAOG_01823 [Capsaspora owczarzaki ATCC 30864]|nr:hypothetical protein CAOG_01823 [Capsaspora owczarzaki ATCC 30864]|eukprot:XP_004364691.1 hypothetical protein CAOG_01823 [Capsaspora owczarzaki ATCC 30864]